MRITKRTNLAFRILMFCGTNADRLVTKSEIAACCNSSESHLAQVINRLAQLGYLRTRRGRSGGVALARGTQDIRVGEVFRHFETNTGLEDCFADVDGSCPLVAACRLRLALAAAAEAFFAQLDGMTLSDLVCGNEALMRIMVPQTCAGRA